MSQTTITQPHPTRLALAAFASLAFMVSACQQAPAEPEQDTPVATPTPEESDTVSILRPEIQLPDITPSVADLEPYRATVGFPEGGRVLDEGAIAALEAVLASPQMELGLAITLGSHSDSTGTDTANLNASEKRGLAVARWLIDQGVDADRITVIAFGEQNPVQPNALPNGAPNEEGRAANRRVEVEVAVPTSEEIVPEDPEASDPEVSNPEGSNPEGSEAEPLNSKSSVEAGD
ncbi:MAG: OmpA family protein [Pseudomonadota bacterium]